MYRCLNVFIQQFEVILFFHQNSCTNHSVFSWKEPPNGKEMKEKHEQQQQQENKRQMPYFRLDLNVIAIECVCVSQCVLTVQTKENKNVRNSWPRIYQQERSAEFSERFTVKTHLKWCCVSMFSYCLIRCVSVCRAWICFAFAMFLLNCNCSIFVLTLRVVVHRFCCGWLGCALLRMRDE